MTFESAAFARFCDPEALGHLLRLEFSRWFADHEVMVRFTILNQRCDAAGRVPSMTVCYRFDIFDPTSDDHRAVVLCAQAYPDGRSTTAYEAIDRRVRDHLDSLDALAHLPALDIIVWKFPHDPGLPHLSEVVDADRVRQHLPYERLPVDVRGPQGMTDVTATVVRYRPGRRCTTRYELRRRGGGQADTLALYGKTFRGQQGQLMSDQMQYLWEVARAGSNGLAVAEPLGYTEAVKTVWQRAVTGTPMYRVVGAADYARYLDAVARGLATLHTCRPPSSRTLTDDHLVASIAQKASALGRAFPALAGRIDEVLGVIRREADAFPPGPRAFIHGDFDLGQLLLAEDGRVFFFDFDDCAQGDPVQDLANFIVDLHFHGFDLPLVRTLAETFTEAYQRYASWGLSPERLRWHAGIQFLTRAYAVHAHQRSTADWHVPHILDLAEAATTGWAREAA